MKNSKLWKIMGQLPKINKKQYLLKTDLYVKGNTEKIGY